MAVKPVVQEGDSVLRTKTPLITDFSDPTFGGLISDMRETLIQEDGLGLAAPQIGASKRIFVIPSEYAPEVRTPWAPFSLLRPIRPTIFVNPELSGYSEEQEVLDEGCLSLRDKFYPTPRSLRVTIQARTETGVRFRVSVDGLLARIFQHETDHLNGILYIDRLRKQFGL
ncbi:MAG: peptide deformylase [Candidatus Spechtbacterales bacterium]